MSQYFPKSFRSFGGNINVEVDLSSYATKTDLKNVTHVDTYSFALKANLALTAVESNIRNVSSLVKKSKLWHKNLTDHNHDKYIATPEFNVLVAEVFNARLAQSNLITKRDFDAKLSSLNRKITTNKWKHLIVKNELKKLKKIDSSYFIAKSHFEEDGAQNYLVFQPMYRYFKMIAGVGNGRYIYYGKSEGLSDERIKSIKTSNHSITPNVSYYGTKTTEGFNESCLKQDIVTFNHGK